MNYLFFVLLLLTCTFSGSAQTEFQVVLTKTDILPPLDLARRATQIQEVSDVKCSFLMLSCNMTFITLTEYLNVERGAALNLPVFEY